MAPDDVPLPPRVVGPTLTVAGLAAWVFLQAGREPEAAECGELQELIEEALQRGLTGVGAPRPVVTRAAELWEAAAELADTWTSTTQRPEQAPERRRQAERLRARAESLRELLGASSHGAGMRPTGDQP